MSNTILSVKICRLSKCHLMCRFPNKMSAYLSYFHETDCRLAI